MDKVNNKLCNVNSYEYDKENKRLTVNYKLVGKRVYENFSEESFLKIENLNTKNKTIGTCLRKELNNI